MYRVLGADGREYGTVNGEVLRQWGFEGRANAETRVLPEGGAEWQTPATVPECEACFPSVPAAPRLVVARGEV